MKLRKITLTIMIAALGLLVAKTVLAQKEAGKRKQVLISHYHLIFS